MNEAPAVEALVHERPVVEDRPSGERFGQPSAHKEIDMRSLVTTLVVFAVILMLLGLFLKAVKWLLILGAVALIAAIVLGVVNGRRTLR